MIWDMRGALHPSKFARKKPTDVAFYGTAKVEGKEYTLKGWIKPPRNPGEQDWVSILFEPKTPSEKEEPFEQCAPVRKERTWSAPDNVDIAAESDPDEQPF